MKVTVAVLADAANTSREGKLNLLGSFDLIAASTFPAVHPSMQLVLRFEASGAEADEVLPLKIRMINQDGQLLGELTGAITVPRPSVAGWPARWTEILPITNMQFTAAGDYLFEILITEEKKAEIPLSIVQLQEMNHGGHNPN